MLHLFEYVDKIVAGFQNLWKRLNISNDDFIRTTQKRHEKVVQEVFVAFMKKAIFIKVNTKAYTALHAKAFGLNANS